MLILSEDSLRMLMTGSGTVVIHAGQFHEKLVVEEASLVYSVGVTLPHFAPVVHRMESTIQWISNSETNG